MRAMAEGQPQPIKSMGQIEAPRGPLARLRPLEQFRARAVRLALIGATIGSINIIACQQPPRRADLPPPPAFAQELETPTPEISSAAATGEPIVGGVGEGLEGPLGAAPLPEPARAEFSPEQQEELLGMIGVPEIKDGKEIYPAGSLIASFQSVDARTYLPEGQWLGQNQQRDEWVTKLKEEIRPAVESGDLQAAKEAAVTLKTEIGIKQGKFRIGRVAEFDGIDLDKNKNEIVDQWEEAVGKLDEVAQKLDGATAMASR